MLSPNECSGLRDILQDIEDQYLFSILGTVTKGMFNTTFRQEAIETILSCTGKPSDLLRKKKVTKNILFNYLVKRGIKVLAEWDKPTLVKECLKFWESTDIYKDSDYGDVPSGNKSLDVSTQMGVAFSKWFFRIWNTLDGFGPEHFWPDSKLTVEVYSPYGSKEVSLTGAMDVVAFLARLIHMDKYFFHANESNDSVMLEIEQHGLIKLLIHGVLHQHSSCVGLFDSAFGLVANPECLNTYKIQLIKIKMQVNSSIQGGLPVNNYPSIC